MAKKRMKGSREARKPKQNKAAKGASSQFGLSGNNADPAKRK